MRSVQRFSIDNVHPHITILGGGPAGLSAAYHARRRSLPFTLYEAGDEVGGNCRTLSVAGHRFDTGAHRLHEDDPSVTDEIRRLLDGRLLSVNAPSRIHVRGRMLDFPLAPLDLMRSLGVRMLGRAVLDKLRASVRSASDTSNFRDFAESRYGRSLAELLLLNYSEKLWGAPADNLSVRVAGGRMKGLDVKTFLLEALLGRRARTRHLDGRFFYPEEGYGAIMQALAREAGFEHIRRNARVATLHHDGGRIRRIGVEGQVPVDVDAVVSTLPLPVALRSLRPAAPQELVEVAERLRFRHLRLVVLVIDRPQYSRNASLYFPDADLPFTRIYEPKNRSAALSPYDETALVVEVPYSTGDAVAGLSGPALIDRIVSVLADRGLLRGEEVKASRTVVLPNAYPVLEVGFESRAERIAAYLESFENMYLVGRSARFEYSHLHRIFAAARDTIDDVRACLNRDASFPEAA